MEHAIDKTGIKIGMWIFLYSEIILFGGLFVLYAIYFHVHPESFVEGGQELNRVFGAANTLVLLISSFTVAASITAIQRRQKKVCHRLACLFDRLRGDFLNQQIFRVGGQISS